MQNIGSSVYIIFHVGHGSRRALDVKSKQENDRYLSTKLHVINEAYVVVKAVILLIMYNNKFSRKFRSDSLHDLALWV